MSYFKFLDIVINSNLLSSAKYQGDVLKRLQNLNQRREEIEGRILVSMTKIEERTASISKEITAVLEGRIDDIEEIAHEQLPKD